MKVCLLWCGGNQKGMGRKYRQGAVSVLCCAAILGMGFAAKAAEWNGDAMGKSERDNTSLLHVIQGADTRETITLNLYNYGSGSTGLNINDKFNDNPKYPGFQNIGGTSEIASLKAFRSPYYMNFGDIITSDWTDGERVTSAAKNPQGINMLRDMGNSPISRYTQVMNKTLVNGYPALKDGTSLAYLFGGEAYSQKVNAQSISGLFLYDEETGIYSFDSQKNFASFRPESDSFLLYQEALTPNFIMYPFGNFMPFNDIVTEAQQVGQIDETYFQEQMQQADNLYRQSGEKRYAQLAKVLAEFMDYARQDGWGEDWTAKQAIEHFFNWSKELPEPEKCLETLSLDSLFSLDYDVASDFFFGMDMEMHFVQPEGGLTGKDGDGDGTPDYPMEFFFAGDDDVWIYIDGVLFLDLSGIHRHVGGKIDFVNGIVSYYGLDTGTGDLSTIPYMSVRFGELIEKSRLNDSGTFPDGTLHSLQLYYIERGSGSSVCQMRFNLPLLGEKVISTMGDRPLEGQTVTELLGGLKIAKQLNSYDPLVKDDTDFWMCITLDGNPLPAGTSYTVGGETREVEKEGLICLRARETACINGILAGTEFTVQEISELGGYAAAYNGDSLTQGKNENGLYVCGSIKSGMDTLVTVTNTELGASVFLSGTESLINPDGEEHTFRFRLEQVTDRYGSGLVSDGKSLETTVTFPQKNGNDSAIFLFTLSYLKKDLLELPQTFYYRLTQIGEDGMQSRLDDVGYVAEVTVAETENGEIQAALTGLYQNGAVVEDASFTTTLIQESIEAASERSANQDKEKSTGVLRYFLLGTVLAAAGLLLYQKKRL